MKVGPGPISIVLGLLALACGKSATGPAQGPTGGLPPAGVGEELVVTVTRGQTATVPGTGLEITLQDVTEDQRCPLRDRDGNPVVCVWQGNADLRLGLFAPGLEPETRVLRSGFDPIVGYGPFRVAFFGLSPERSLDIVIEPADYVATLRVTGPPSGRD